MQINVAEYLEQGALATSPQKTAIIDGANRYTFSDLERYAKRCASLLIQRTAGTSNAIAVFLPKGGLFLAGGVVAKNVDRFLEDGCFMARFERNYRTHLDQLTRGTPIYLVHDYDLSLYGAAHAPACTHGSTRQAPS